MKTFSVCIAIIILSSACFAASAANPITIVVGAYENAPKIYTDDDGTISGFWPDLLRAIATKENWEIEWVPGTWQESLQRLQANKINILPDTGWTEQRSQVYAFNQESVLISWARVYVPMGSDIESIMDLEAQSIVAR